MALTIVCYHFPGGIVGVRLFAPVPSRRLLDVDPLDAQELEQRLQAEMRDGATNFLIDLRNVAYLHSQAIWAAARAGDELGRARGQVVLAGLTESLQRLIEAISASRSLKIVPEPAAGLRLLGLNDIDRAVEQFNANPETGDSRRSKRRKLQPQIK